MATVAEFTDPIRERPEAVDREIWSERSPHLPFLPSRRVCKGGGRNRLPRLKPDWPENGSKQPSSGPRVLGNFSRVLKLKMSALGLGFYLAHKNRFI